MLPIFSLCFKDLGIILLVAGDSGIHIDCYIDNVIFYHSIFKTLINPFRTVAISKLLEMIGRSSYFLTWSIATALHSDIKKDCRLGW